MSFLKDFNPEQEKAVTTTQGPLIIIAGPGTGKTRTLIGRIAYLISAKQALPSKILAITFTRKAVEEIKQRLTFALAKNCKTFPMVCTFHSLGYELLKLDNQQLKVISEAERWQLIRQLRQTEFQNSPLEKLTLKEWSFLISKTKQNLSSSNLNSPEIKQLLEIYNEYLQKRQMVDFDDLLTLSLEKLKNESAFRKKLKERFDYILVDEFQDTNDLQYQLIQQLLSPEKNLCVIGDPLQSIYAFRGAKIEIFSQFRKDFPDHQEISLTTNYRSTEPIIKVSSSLFPTALPIKARLKIPGQVKLIETLNQYSEANWILAEINNLIGGIDFHKAGEVKNQKETQANFSDFAVIYRLHGLSRNLEQKFIDSGIPYQIIGGNSLYQQPEICFIISILRHLIKPDDEAIFKELLQSKFSQLTEAIVTTIIKVQKLDSTNLYKTAWSIIKGSFLNKKQKQKLLAFLESLEKILESFETQKVSETVEAIIQEFNLRKQLTDKLRQLQNLNQFQGNILQFDQYADSLQQLLKYLDCLADSDFYDIASDKVALLTMHAAKGLEFKYVFICGFEEGLIPFTKKSQELTDLEEEKRLLYVAMTRAKQGLYLLTARERNRNKLIKPSRFKKLFPALELTEVKDEAIEKILKKRQRQRLQKSQMNLF